MSAKFFNLLSAGEIALELRHWACVPQNGFLGQSFGGGNILAAHPQCPRNPAIQKRAHEKLELDVPYFLGKLQSIEWMQITPETTSITILLKNHKPVTIIV
jgi:hypothetical protein